MKFSDLYVDYAKDITDAPEQFSRMLAYFVLSCTVNRSVSLPFGYKKLYPNLYLLIAAPSSAHRKSWSQKMAMNLVNQIHPDLEIPELSSREAFIAELGREDRSPHETGTIVIDELGGFLGRAKGSPHMNGFLQDLSSAYDGSRIYRRSGVSDEKKTVIKIENPFLNMSAACSLSWLTESAKASDITGGFLARFLWVVEDGKVLTPRDMPGQEDQEKKQLLINKLTWINDIIGEAHFNEEAKKAWSAWYQEFRGQKQGGMWDANYERLTTIAMKLAMLMAVERLEAEAPDTLVTDVEVTHTDIWRSASMVEDSTLSFDKVIIGDTPMEIQQSKIRQYIRRQGEVTRSELLRHSHLSAWHLDNVIKTLIQSEEISEDRIDDIVGHRPTTTYRWDKV